MILFGLKRHAVSLHNLCHFLSHPIFNTLESITIKYKELSHRLIDAGHIE